MTELILIRHGQSIANQEGRFAGHSDFGLTELGHRQARLCADYIRKNFKVDAVWASDLSRAYDTAVPTAKAFSLPIIPDKALREIYAGKWEGLHRDEIAERFSEDFDVWINDIASARCTGGESVAELYARICPRILEIARENEGKTIAIATHATPIRVLETMARGFGPAHVGDFPFVANASVSIYRYDRGVISLVTPNIKEYMGDLVTEVKRFNPKEKK